jgi:hypothetical protein
MTNTFQIPNAKIQRTSQSPKSKNQMTKGSVIAVSQSPEHSEGEVWPSHYRAEIAWAGLASLARTQEEVPRDNRGMACHCKHLKGAWQALVFQ